MKVEKKGGSDIHQGINSINKMNFFGSESCIMPIETACPITDPGSDPQCGRVDTGPGVTIFCVGESPWLFGGDFDFTQTVGGTIKSIKTQDNRKNYCSEPTGVGSDTFSVHCECSNGCLITGEWAVYWDAADAL